MSTTTETKITRAEVVRRFKSATAYMVESRSFKGVDTPANNGGKGATITGIRREIDRVTTTGVYVKGGPIYAMTRFESDLTWTADADTITGVNTYTDRETGETREYLRITYRLEVAS